MTGLLGIREVAQLLGRSSETIRKNLRSNPAAVPPRCVIPGTRLLRWRAADVEVWLSKHVERAGENK